MEQLRLNDILERPGADVSLFTAFETVSTGRTVYKAPWTEDTELVSVMLPSLDLAYYYRSGEKWATPFIRSLIDTAPLLHPDGKLLQTDLTVLVNQCLALFCDKWTREYATRLAEYDPLKNYDMTENMIDDEKVTEYGRTSTRTNNLTHAKTGTETDTKNLQDQRTNNLSHGKTGTDTETTTPNLTTTEAKNVYGFNSTDPTPSESVTTTATGTNTVQTSHNTTETDTGTQTDAHTGTDAVTYNVTDADTGTQADAVTGSDTETRNYELTRTGNIGVTTSQQMLESERAVWLWSFFSDVVFPDIDKLTVLSVY